MIGVIGFGRFGELLCRYLSEDFHIFVHEIKDIRIAHGTKADLKTVCSQPIVIPAVPISAFGEVIASVRPYVKQDTLLIDVCSVKEHPVAIMKELDVQILASHPMFGPDSAADSLQKKKIVLCPVRIADNRYSSIRSYLENKGLVCIEATPEEHDKQIAQTQVLTHFIGRALLEMKARPHDIDTEGYRRLMHILEVVQNDTWQLFEDMNQYNQYAQDVRRRFQEALEKVEDAS